MILLFALIPVVLSLILVVSVQLRRFRGNLEEARRSGFPYLIVPFSPFFIPWVLVQPYALPLLSLLPKSWTHLWLEYACNYHQTAFMIDLCPVFWLRTIRGIMAICLSKT